MKEKQCVRLTVRMIRSLIREEIKVHCTAGSHPDETYNQILIYDPLYDKHSIYVPDDVKDNIKKWIKAMGLDGYKRSY